MVLEGKELLIAMWEGKILNEGGKDKLIEMLIHPERAINKAKETMKNIPKEYKPKVKQRGYQKK